MASCIIFDNHYRNMTIQANQEQGCYKDILDKIYGLFNYMINKHNKILFVRFDVTYPENYNAPEGNDIFEKFIANFIKNRSRAGYDPKYLWVREQHTSSNSHYHCILLLDGNKTQNIYGHLAEVEKFWSNALRLDINETKGLINYCNRYSDGMMIRRNTTDFNSQLTAAYQWASYLGKINSKQRIDGVRNYGCSILI